MGMTTAIILITALAGFIVYLIIEHALDKDR